ncbi:MAG: T9SS type A sorting domain-containing protein [Saprospiraceae bacterium]
MKILKLIYFLFIISHISGQNYLNKAIPSFENNADGILCQAMSDSTNGIVTFVHSYVYTKNKYINRFCRLGRLGEVLNLRNNLDSINPELIMNFKKISSGYLTSGYQFKATDTTNHFWYAKLNDQFDTMWTRGFKKKNNNSSFNNIIELRNKNIGLTGTDMQVRPNGTSLATLPCIAIADSLGNLIHYTEVKGADSLRNGVLFGITEGPDSSVYAAGYIVKLDALLDQDPVIAKVNSQGELQWRRQITNKGFNEIFLSVFTQIDGSVLGVGGSYNDYDARKEFSYVLLINFDTSGNINWTRRIFKGLFNDCYNAVQDKYGNIIGTGLYNRYRGFYADTSQGHGWIFKCNSTGDSIWSRKIIHANDSFPERFNNISQAPDGGFYLTGYSFLPGDYSSKAWIVKTDSFGCVVPGCEKVVASEDIQNGKEKAFVFFPNPVVYNKFFFLSRIGTGESYRLRLYNLQGACILTYPFRTFEGAQYEVDLKNEVGAGYYVVQIQDENGRIVCGEKTEVVR